MTHKLFLQTWHYYTSLIPVFFLLGGAKFVAVLIDLIGPVLTNRGNVLIDQPEKFTDGLSYITRAGKFMKDTSPINQLYTMVTKLENKSEIMLWIFVIWAAGSIILLMLNFKRYKNFKHFILQNHRIYNTEQSNTKVVISVNAKSPMAMGFLKPIVILPDVHYKERELALILSHEHTHIKRGDPLIKLILIIAKAVHWFNPFIYLLSGQLNDYCELSCDEKVVQKMDTESRRSYSEMILSMLDYGVNKRSIVDVACVSNLCNTKNNIKRRLLSIMNTKKMKKSTIALSVFATVLLMVIGTFAAYSYESQVPEGIQFDTANHDNLTIQEKEINTKNELMLEVDVPFRMKYQDPYAEPPLDIDIQPGEQVLTGDDAEAYLGFRKLN